ncbi:T9SS type A sorting domain-containing protein [Tenacibaculum finnmarkense]|uniref:MBG domain-containing protein n=1 Tax=Tenacibaculum finnmarkense TaxID=2781243 RepID=UPI001EFBB9E0|nr:MBG domain-containing protein [Tenacibaculum finnmarkense]MCG8804102.1 T9SS type A sorting domain-containing protein [Tenacibaculum finnmarkense]MCG8856158.1 T9SS type A sorting domain-containing protein [Tenacibaculum finnmarkense]
MKHYYLKLLLIPLFILSKQLYSQTPSTMGFGSSTVVIANATNPSHDYSANSLIPSDNAKLNGFDMSATTSGSIFLAFALNGNGAGTSTIGGGGDAVLSWVGNGATSVFSGTLKTDTGGEIGITSMHFAYELVVGSLPSTFTFTAKKDGATVGTLVLNSPSALSDITLDFTSPTTGSFTNIDEIVLTPSIPILGGFSVDDMIIVSAVSKTPPTVTTTAVGSIGETSATLAGDVIADGGDTVSERGIVYSVTATNANPLIAGTGVTKNTNGTGTGAFSESMPGLTPGTSYSYKAYAINSEGTSYGTVETFTTLVAPLITFSNINKTYGDANFNLGATSNSAGTITYSIEGSNTTGTTLSGTNSSTVNLGNAGSLTIRATQTANGIYSAGTKDITLTIGKATLTATADNKAKTYGDANPAFTVSYSGFKNSETSAVLTVEPFASSIATTTTNVGTVDIDVAGGLDNNYDLLYVKGTLTIGKATLTATADNKAKTYGDVNPAFTLSYSGFKNSETSAVLTVEPFASSIATATTNVGTVDIDVAGGLDNNYDLLYVKGTLTIGKATLTATADNKAKTYGDVNPAFTLSYSGFKNSETSAVLTVEPFASSIATSTTNVGAVDINISAGLDNNYNFIYVKGTLTISSNTITWTGTTDNDWDKTSNWSTNTIPTASNVVTIPSELTNYPTASSAVTCNSLTIESGATFIPQSTVTGSIIYKRNLPTTNWSLVTSPIANETLENVITNNTFATGTASNIGISTYANSGASPWTYFNTGSTGNIIPGMGLSVKLATAGELSSTGTALNTSNVIFGVSTGTRTNFNLLGNPFTAYINSGTFTTTNTGVLTEDTIWLWNGTVYETYNATTPIEIAPGQAFFIEASTNGAIIFTTSNRSHQNTDTFKRPATKQSFELFVENNADKKSTKVFYIADKTTGFDNGYDSKMFTDTTSNFDVFTELISDNKGNKLAIQTLPTSKIEEMVIPVGLTAKSGKEVTFSVNTQNLPADVKIYLEDRKTNTFTNISEKSHKIVLENQAKGTGQFYIHTTSKNLEIASIPENLQEDLQKINIFKSANNSVTITGLQNKNTSVNVFSMLGKKVISKQFKATGVHVIQLPKTAKGVYIVELTSNSEKITKKIILE